MQSTEVVALLLTGVIFGFFGGLGGAVRAAVLRTTWIETLRVIFVGTATAFSCGVLSPTLLAPFVGEMSAGMGKSLGTLCAGAFLTGLVAVTYVERLISRQTERNDSQKGQSDVPGK